MTVTQSLQAEEVDHSDWLYLLVLIAKSPFKSPHTNRVGLSIKWSHIYYA